MQPDLTQEQQQLPDRYVDAFWRKDIDTIVSLLTAEAVGDAAVHRVVPRRRHDRPPDRHPLPGRLLRHADDRHQRQRPAGFGLYMRPGRATSSPFQLQVLELDGDRVRHVSAFFDTSLAAFAARPPAPETDHAAASTPGPSRRQHPRAGPE